MRTDMYVLISLVNYSVFFHSAEVSEAIDLHALTEVNVALLTEMKQLDSVDDVTKFWKSSDKKTVESQIGLIKEFVSDTNCTGTPCPKGFIVKRNNNVTSFSSDLPEDMCEQFVYTQLTLELQNASRRDYTEVNKRLGITVTLIKYTGF